MSAFESHETTKIDRVNKEKRKKSKEWQKEHILLKIYIIEEYTKQGYWTETTMADLWDRNDRMYPNKEAYIVWFSSN